MKLSRKLTMVTAALLSLSLLAAACGDDADKAVTDDAFIVVDEGEEIQIRSLNAITGDVAFLGIPNQNAVMAAIADYGDIEGFSVSMGQGLDDLSAPPTVARPPHRPSWLMPRSSVSSAPRALVRPPLLLR